GHVLSEVEQVADRVAIMRRGRLMHVEDLHERRGLRMLLVKYAGTPPATYPDELEITLRRREQDVDLVEHRGGIGPLLGWLHGQGGFAMDCSTAAIEMAFWNHPFILLMFSAWAIARGSGAVAGELERGTMDLVMSRPVSRSSFLSAQVIVGVFGLVLMVAAM